MLLLFNQWRYETVNMKKSTELIELFDITCSLELYSFCNYIIFVIVFCFYFISNWKSARLRCYNDNSLFEVTERALI